MTHRSIKEREESLVRLIEYKFSYQKRFKKTGWSRPFFLLQLSPLKEDLYIKIQGNTHIENLVFMNLFSLVDKSFLGTKEMIS